MSGPRRLLESDDATTRLLMDAALEEPSPPGARQRALVSLGLAGAVTGTAAGAGAAAAATQGAAGATSALSAAKGGMVVVFAKWLAGGAVAGVLVSAAATTLTQPPADPQRAPAPAAPAGPTATALETIAPRAAAPAPMDDEPGARAPESPPEQRAPSGAPAPQDPGDVPPPQAHEPGSLPPTATFAPSGSGLDAEVELLDQARRALSAGAPGRAIALLDRHGREFPRGRLGSEAFVLRLDALSRSGQRDRARELARRHLAKHPRAPHAARIRRLVGLPPQEK